MIIINCKLCSL